MTVIKILIGCTIPESILDEFRALGTDLIYEPAIAADRLEKIIGDVNILVVSRNRVSPEIIAAGRALQMIIRAGTDTSNISIEEASKAGIFVCNCPYMDAIAIAELTFGYLIALDRRLFAHTQATRQQKPTVFPQLEASGLAGRTLGVLGYGPVEKQIIKRALAFEMNVKAWSPASLTPEIAAESKIGFGDRPRDVARESDMLSIYVSSRSQTEQLVDVELLGSMKPGACLVYIGHPGALDLSALVEAASRQDIWVAYDISAPQLTAGDIGRFIARLQALPNVMGTYGLADRTRQARETTGNEVLRIVREFIVNGKVLNCLNLIEYNPAMWQLLLRLKDRVGVLASIMDVLRADGISMEDITSHLFTGAQAAWIILAVDERPSAEALAAIRNLDGVLNLEIRAMV
jgi:D-3-phosphoglycerate dehydrogenase / 2-oxoglutarate reductase